MLKENINYFENSDNSDDSSLTRRQKDILKAIILEFLKTAKAVGSKILTQNYNFSVSPATIRNEMVYLTEKDFIRQPHTSAGRIPTEKGYMFYINDIIDFDKNIPEDKINLMQTLLSQNYQSIDLMLSSVLRFLANASGQLSIVAEPDFSSGVLKKFNLFKIETHKLVIAISLESGLDKTFVIQNRDNISEDQISALVRYLNNNYAKKSINSIKELIAKDLDSDISKRQKILANLIKTIKRSLDKVTKYKLNFDGKIGFLSQPEFNSPETILKLLELIDNQNYFMNIFKNYAQGDYTILMGDEINRKEFSELVLIFGKYNVLDIPGYIGILGTKRMNYRENIPMICFASKMITEMTSTGTIMPSQLMDKK